MHHLGAGHNYTLVVVVVTGENSGTRRRGRRTHKQLAVNENVFRPFWKPHMGRTGEAVLKIKKMCRDGRLLVDGTASVWLCHWPFIVGYNVTFDRPPKPTKTHRRDNGRLQDFKRFRRFHSSSLSLRAMGLMSFFLEL